MTNPQHEALVDAVAQAIRPVLESDSEIYWASEYGRPTPQASLDAIARAAIAALSATAATPSEEEVRLRAALKKIADGTLISLECGDTWPSPLGAKASQNLARAALEPQGKDV